MSSETGKEMQHGTSASSAHGTYMDIFMAEIMQLFRHSKYIMELLY